MRQIEYKLTAYVCAVLFVASGCSRETGSNAPHLTEQDAGAADASKSERSPGQDGGHTDAGTRTSSGREDSAAQAGKGGSPATKADKGKADDKAKNEAGSGGMQSESSRPRAGAGGSNGSNTPSREAMAGAGGQSVAGSRAQGGPLPGAAGAPAAGTGGTMASMEEAGEGDEGDQDESGGAGGMMADAGSGGDSEEGGDEGGDEGGEQSAACGQIASACAAVSELNLEATTCLTVGRDADATACEASLADCREICGIALCQRLADDCHDVDLGEGPQHDCHDLGHAGAADACFAGGIECLALCQEAN